MSDAMSLHLTNPNPDLAARVAATPSGMAHWSGTGPEFVTCRECKHFDHQNSYYTKKGMGGGALRPARCKKYRSMTGQNGGVIPHETRACKYFDQADSAPPIQSKS